MDRLGTKISEIIAQADLNVITSKQVRSRLQSDFGFDIADKKDVVDAMIDAAVVQRLQTLEQPRDREPAAPAAEEDADYLLAKELQDADRGRLRRAKVDKKGPVKEKKKRAKEAVSGEKTPRSNPFNRPYLLSDALSNLLGGAKALSRPQVVKHIWAYVREHDLQDPTNRRFIICDELLRAVFRKSKVSCFSMNKTLSNHLMAPHECTEANL